MSVPNDHDAELVHDLAYALSRSMLRPRVHVSFDLCVPVAQDIVRYLELAGWLFTRRPPDPPHSTHQ